MQTILYSLPLAAPRCLMAGWPMLSPGDIAIVCAANASPDDPIWQVIAADNAAAINPVLDARANLSVALCQEVLSDSADMLSMNMRNAAVVNISPAEMASWPIKLNEANAYQASGSPSDAPNLLAEATQRGITLAALAQMVIDNGAALAGIEATLAGICGAHKDRINSLMTVDALCAYDLYGTGWPGLPPMQPLTTGTT